MIHNIFKPKDWTSFDVVAKLRGVLKTKKIGHAGTLDPLAEGVLVILTGPDTKLQDRLMKTTKEYVTEFTFGITTLTYDLEMTPTYNPNIEHLNLTLGQLTDVTNKYIGQIEQTAPPYSAKKVGGKTLYKEARKGRIDQIQLPVKTVEIHKIDVLDFYDREIETDLGVKTLPAVKLKIECSSGTYVRSLAHDIGEELGVGAVMTSLVRTRVGNYKVEDSRTIESFVRE